MTGVVKRYKVNFFECRCPAVVEVVQGDSARVLEFEPTDYEIPEGAVCTYYVDRPSKVPVYNTATIADNVITVDLTAESLAEAGENHLQVRIEKNDKVLTSFSVVLIVRAFGGIGAVKSTSESNVFDQAIERAKEQIAESSNFEVYVEGTSLVINTLVVNANGVKY